MDKSFKILNTHLPLSWLGCLGTRGAEPPPPAFTAHGVKAHLELFGGRWLCLLPGLPSPPMAPCPACRDRGV
jgi:hypothetical protein